MPVMPVMPVVPVVPVVPVMLCVFRYFQRHPGSQQIQQKPRARRGQTRGHGEGAWETAPGEQLRTA